MTARRIATSLVMATAAFASIATSQAPLWTLEATEQLESTVVEDGPATTFGITAEARGPRGGHDGGDVDVFLEVAGGGENLDGATVRIALISEADPTQREEQELIVTIGAPLTASFFMPAWDSCQAGPCFEDFRLEITNTTPNTSVTVSGQVRATLRGRDQEPEPDSEVVLEITPLGVAP